MLDAEAALQQRSIAEQLQVRIDQAQAQILKAPTELRARIVKEEVSRLGSFHHGAASSHQQEYHIPLPMPRCMACSLSD